MIRVKYLIYFLVLINFFSSCKSSKIITDPTLVNNSSENLMRKKYADKLNVTEQQLLNIKLYKFIDEWYGTKYKLGGLDKSGIDCSGFVFKLYDIVYSRKIPRTTEEINGISKQLDKNKIKEGDFVFFKINSKKVSHVGVYLINDKFVHASSQKGIMISDLNEPYFQQHFFNGGRVK